MSIYQSWPPPAPVPAAIDPPPATADTSPAGIPSSPRGTSPWVDLARLFLTEGRVANRSGLPVNAADYLPVGQTLTATDHTTAITSAWATAMAADRALYIPALPGGGAWTFNGPALNTTNANPHIYGDGRYRTNINLAAGVRFIDMSTTINVLYMHDLAFSGGIGAFRSTFAGAASTVYKIIERVHFENYTGCNWETNASDDPYWTFRECRFRGLDFIATMGVALGGGGGERLLDCSLFDHCDFIRNRYDVKLPVAGNVQFKNCSFLRFSGASPGDRAYIWCVPDTNLINPGVGLLCTGTKFGSEGALAGDHVVLYADEDAASGTSWGTRFPDLTHDSTGNIVGHTFRDNNYNGAIGVARPLFYSTTPHIRGCTYAGTIEASAGITYLFEFRTAPTQDERNVSSILGPFMSDTVGVSSVGGLDAFPKLTNAPGSFFIIDHTGQWAGKPDAPAPFPGGSNSGEYIRILPTLINNFTAVGGPTKSTVTDAMGGQDAIEIAFTGVSDSYFGQCAGAVLGRPVWIEFDVQNGVGGAPLGFVYVKLRRGGAGFSHLVRITEADATWRTVRVLCPSLRDIGAQPTVFFSTSAIGTVRIGRVRCYQAREPIAPELIPAMPAVVSAAAIQLPSEGRAFGLTGVVTVNHLAMSYPGRFVLLHTTGAGLTLTNNAGAPPAGYAPMLLNGGVNFALTTNDVIGLLFNGTNWVGCAPGSVN